MPRWNELPVSLDQRALRLVVPRRRLRRRGGPGLPARARRSATRNDARASGGAGESVAPANRSAGGRTWLTLAAVSVLSAALVAVLLVTRPWQYGETGTATVHVSAQPAFVFERGQCHRCLVAFQAGELRAGYSTTRATITDADSRGWEIIEAQCLLRHHGYDPGVPDGEYDAQVKDAVERFQRDRGLVVDGIVGPGTWRELRHADGHAAHGFHSGHGHGFDRIGGVPQPRRATGADPVHVSSPTPPPAPTPGPATLPRTPRSPRRSAMTARPVRYPAPRSSPRC